MARVARKAAQLEITWRVEEPEGAPVSACDVQLAGSLRWADAFFCDGPSRSSANTWRATLDKLEGATTYQVRVRGRNGVGVGEWSPPAIFDTSPSPSAPSALECTWRHVDGLLLEWSAADPEGAAVSGCEVQVASSLGWSSAALWGAAEPRQTTPVGKREARSWSARVVQLASATDYTLRLRAVNDSGAGEWSDPLSVRTSDVPPAPTMLRCDGRRPETLPIRWHLEDPEGAPVEACDVQVTGSLMWKDALVVSRGGSPCEPERVDSVRGEWQAMLGGLAPQTTYRCRVRGRSRAGVGPWVDVAFATSDPPSAPEELRCLRRLPDRLPLEWRLQDTEGAAVAGCDVEVKGFRRWEPAAFLDGAAPCRGSGDVWHVCVAKLKGGSAYQVRVRGRSAAGEGVWAEGCYKTSELPSEPQDLSCLQRLPDTLPLKWRLEDPEGAEVTACDVEVGGPSRWQPAALGGAGIPERLPCGLWRAIAQDLAPATLHGLRVRGRSAAGEGAWATGSFRTSDAPGPPLDLHSLERFPDRLPLEWRLADPAGAEVLACEVEVLGDTGWRAARLEEQGGAARAASGAPAQEGALWRATVLFGGDDSPTALPRREVRVRGVSLAGAGPWHKASLETSPPPAAPHSLLCTRRTARRAEVQVETTDPPGAPVTGLEVEIRSGGAWESAPLDAMSPRRSGGKWLCEMAGLKEDTTFQVRVRSLNAVGASAWSEQVAITTDGKPTKPTDFMWRHERPGEVLLQWRAGGPEDASVGSCQVFRLLKPSVGSPYWEPAQLRGGTVRRVRNDSWQTIAVGIAPASLVTFAIFGTNASGDSPWLRVEFRTMSVPEAPASIRCVEERPDAVVLEWRVSEEVGAEVTACQVQISGSIWWQDAKFAEGGEPQRFSGDVWRAVVAGLALGAEHTLQLRALSAVGEGPWARFVFRTAEGGGA